MSAIGRRDVLLKAPEKGEGNLDLVKSMRWYHPAICLPKFLPLETDIPAVRVQFTPHKYAALMLAQVATPSKNARSTK